MVFNKLGGHREIDEYKLNWCNLKVHAFGSTRTTRCTAFPLIRRHGLRVDVHRGLDVGVT